jgi:hypothetical protein
MSDVISVKGRLRLVLHNGVYFFVSSRNEDAVLGAYFGSFDAYLRRLDPALARGVDPADWLHLNVLKFMETVRRLAVARTHKGGELRDLVALSASLVSYLDSKCEELGIVRLPDWLHGIGLTTGHPDARRVLADIVQETIDHFLVFARERAPDLVAVLPPRPPASAERGTIEDHVPQSVLDLKTEATLPVIRPWFERSLDIAGDIVEFGCYKGTLSIKYAFYVRALGQAKTIYAFDTFEGFRIADPGGGALGVGAYEDNDNAYDELCKWAKILPLVPVKGDATETCKSLTKPLSFVWFDLDMAVLMEPVLRYILALCSRETVIGVDDYGRPETPTVKPWADATEARGVWEKLREYPDTHIAFYRLRR